MANGVVKWFSDKKGFGFIEQEGGQGDIFVHHTGVEDHGHFGLQKDDRVSFEVKSTPRGTQAVKVKPISLSNP